MAHGQITAVEAVKAWVLRAYGCKVRDICNRFDVDPRRLYEVWEELEFKGSRQKAVELFERKFPKLKSEGRFEVHRPRYVRAIKSGEQLALPYT